MRKTYAIMVLLIFTSGYMYGQDHTSVKNKYYSIEQTINNEENKSYNIKTVGILVYDDFADLDAIGIQSDFSSVMGTHVFFIAPEKGIIVSGTGNSYKVDTSIDEVAHLDVLVIPGGLQTTRLLTKNQKVLDWIRKIDSTSTFTSSVCTGAWVLGATGLLKGRNATTHWYRGPEMLKKYGANYQNRRYVRDGKYWTAAGVSAGIDMGLAMILCTKGKTYTEFAALNLQYDPQSPVNGAPERADPELIKMMTELYDIGLNEGRKKMKENNSQSRK